MLYFQVDSKMMKSSRSSLTFNLTLSRRFRFHFTTAVEVDSNLNYDSIIELNSVVVKTIIRNTIELVKRMITKITPARRKSN